jgi:putative ABC transport system permease protein
MLKNYFLTALRNLRTTKTFSLINILGLAIGISAALVIYLIIDFDLSFENFQPNASCIYRVVTDVNMNGDEFHLAAVPYPLPAAARKDLTGLAECTAIFPTAMEVAPSQPGKAHPAIFGTESVTFTDAHYFKLFRFYTWLAGSADGLDLPNHTVLCAKRAAIYFPGLTPAQVVGKTILYNDSIPSTITGIVSDPPDNTDFAWLEFFSISTSTHTHILQYSDPNDWGNIHGNYRCMVELTPGTPPASIDRQLAGLRRKYSGDTTGADVHRLQPLSDIHFNATYDAFYRRMAHKPTLYGLLLVAAFLLILGCINFINLTTANAAHRAKEIGIRKTLGSSQQQLVLQFLGETFLLTFSSLICSILLTPWLLHAFADFIPADLHFRPLHQPGLWLFAGTLLLTVTALAGLYPAWILSRFRPALVLKDQAYAGSSSTRSALLRKCLTTFQFLFAQAFIMATIIVGRQLHYTLTADLGYKKDAIVFFETPFTLDKENKNRFVLLNRLRGIAGIERSGTASVPPTFDFPVTTALHYSDGKKINSYQQIQVRCGDSNFIKIYRLRLLAGRNLRPSDTIAEFLINDSYCQLLGFKKPEDALGKLIMNGSQPVPIVGVIPDFHQESLHSPIKPLVISWAANDQQFIQIALQPQTSDGAGWKHTLAQVRTAFQSIYPGQDFEPQFVDEAIAKYYVAEQHLSSLLQWATGLTIVISCLGLAGLVIFTTNAKRKEIGIRKVLGAPVIAIITGLSKEFVILLLIAFVIATPIAWWALHKWLESFVYRIPVSWWIFPLAGGTMMGFALLTMSIRTLRAATANPIGSLRSE